MERIVKILQSGGVGVLPTDTIYGVVGSALKKSTVLRIYKLRKRNLKKPMIILIGSLDDLKLFNIKLNAKTRKVLLKFWPGKVSIILPCRSKEFHYLHRGTKSLAFRLPKPNWLKSLLVKTGPLVAPSANYEGSKPSKTVKDAQKYFGKKIDFYFDRGRLTSLPSTLIAVKSGHVILKREGAVNPVTKLR